MTTIRIQMSARAWCSEVFVLFIVMVAVDNVAIAATAISAERQYRDLCSVCHGDNGDGNTHVRQGLQPPPRDFTTSEAASQLSRERMIDAVRRGRTGTAMVSWKERLSDDEIEALVDYIRTKFMVADERAERDNGLAIYARTCAVCHGDEGKGALWGQSSLQPPPRDFTTAAARQLLTRERMIAAVTHGRPGTAMAAFGSQLSQSDIEAVVNYIRATFVVAGSKTAAPDDLAHGVAVTGTEHDHGAADHSLPLPDGLQGDAAAGQAYYLQNCTACHGKEGDGKGPRSAFIFPKPRNFLHPSSRMTFTRPALFRAVRDGVVGREMPAWGKVFNDQQIADVAEYVYQAFIQSGTARATPEP